MGLLADVLGTTQTQRRSIDDDDDDEEDRYRCHIGKSGYTVKRCWIVKVDSVGKKRGKVRKGTDEE